MIYIDSSVALAEILLEDRRPSEDFWREPLVSSRLLEFEICNRTHVYGAGRFAQIKAQDILDAVSMVEMSRETLSRALVPFPLPVRTLDGLHLATVHSLRGTGFPVEFATYDRRMRAAASAMGLPVVSV